MAALFLPGDPVPDFTVRSTNNDRFHFNTIAGRYVVLSFFGSLAEPARAAAVRQFLTDQRVRFDDEHLLFFGVSTDPEDEAQGRLQQQLPGIRHFWDFDGAVSRRYGALTEAGYHPFTLVLDPLLRVLAFLSMQDIALHYTRLEGFLASLPPVERHAGVKLNAPVLTVPRIFEPEFCEGLIALYRRHGGTDSGFMREQGDKTVGILDHHFKRRSDYTLTDASLMAEARERISRRLLPEIRRAFQFPVTRMERYIVARYDGESGGFFRPHRDNTTPATAHRRFACTLNLNTGDYQGGGLRFPEFGPDVYVAPRGGAVVFSCSLLHEALPVTQGERFAFLPFFYDEAAAKLRAENQSSLSGEVLNLNAVHASSPDAAE